MILNLKPNDSASLIFDVLNLKLSLSVFLRRSYTTGTKMRQNMDYVIVVALISCMLWNSSNGEAPQEVRILPKPYAFSYKAGRMPGHVDRVHSEVGDEKGVIRGMFSYVDPRQQIRTVEYLADQNGFHPLLITNPTEDTKAVQNAKLNHFVLFNQIAEEHAREAAERGDSDDYQEYNTDDGYDSQVLISHPRDTPAVERAKLRHYDLYNKIALEHAKIALERGGYDNGDYHEEEPAEDKIVKIGYYKY